MSGAGTQPAGTTSAGYGEPSTATEVGGAFLRDTKTGKSLGARKVDPHTRNYVMDANGRILGVNSVRAAVQLSLHTERGSAVVQDMGHRLREIERITPSTERQILAALTAAVQPLIAQGLIEVVGFKNFRAGDDKNGMRRGAVYGRFLWRDLTTDQEHEEFV